MSASRKNLKDVWEYTALAVIASALSARWLIAGRVGLGSRYRSGAGVTYISRTDDAYAYWMWVGLFLFLGAYTALRGGLALRSYLRHRRGKPSRHDG
jgi:hypothetical protein